MSSNSVPWGACALVLSLIAAPGPAARAEGAPAPAATAPEPPAPTLPPVQMEEVVIRLPRAEAAGDPTASATVVEAGRFAGEAKDVAALVATAPGVAVNDYGGLGQLATVSIRGSTADGVLVLIDGLPLNAAFGGGVDLSSIPRAWIDRIEVVRGPAGAYYGAGALGGVVNVVTRSAALPRWSVEGSAGSFETFALSGDAAFGAPGRMTLLGASAEATGGRFPYLYDQGLPGGPLEPAVRANNAARRASAIAKTGRPAGAGRLDALLQVSAGHRELPGFAESPTPWAWQDDARLVGMARLAVGALAGGASLAARAHLRLDLLDTLVTGPSDAPVRQRGGGAGLALLGTLPHGGGELGASLELSEELVRSDGLGESRQRGRAALAVKDDLLAWGGRLRVAPALRLEQDGGYTGLSGAFGLGWRLADGLALRASAGRTFRAPGIAELYLQQGLVAPNPDLRPEEGLAADASLVADGRLGLASIGGHVTRYADLVIYEPSDAFGRLKPFNTGEALASGLEAELASAPLAGSLRATVAASYTLLVTELLRGSPAEVGHWLPYRPRHRLYARAGVAPGPLEAHLEAHFVGLRYQDRRNVNPIPASLAWNAGASVALARAPVLRLHLEVKNLTDDRTLSDGFGNPLPSRMVMFTLRAGAAPQEGTP